MRRVAAIVWLAGCTSGGAPDSEPVVGPDATLPCRLDQSRLCYEGDTAEIGKGPCAQGSQSCLAGPDEFTHWGPCVGAVAPTVEVCNGEDDDCDGTVDDVADGCTVTITVDLDGDCLDVLCPDDLPYVLGCDVTFEGGDPRGCVALIEMGQGLYFQEGNDCGAGRLTGTITCGASAGMPLSPALCPIDKEEPIYAPSPDFCPDTT
jgi:hypothetical protein